MNKRIKILFTIPNFDTAGSGKVVYDLVKGLDKTRFEPEICCVHNKGEFFKVIEALGVKIHLFSFFVPYRPYLMFPFKVLQIMRFFKRHQFDLIHSWHWSSDISEPLAAKLAGIPFVYTKKAMGWGNKSWIWRSKLSTQIIAINTDMMTSFFSGMLAKTKYIPLGVDTIYFKPLKKHFTTPEGLKFNSKDFVIVSIVNLAPVKGLEVLLEAVKALHDPYLKVLIVGDYTSDYGVYLKTTYFNDQTFFLGKQLDVRPYLSLADLFVIPTKNEGRKEGMPIAPLEAMACQRVVIGSDIAGIKDILESFPECLFEANDILALRHKIETIQKMTDETRENIAKAMRKSVEDSFPIEKFISRHETFYENLINKY